MNEDSTNQFLIGVAADSDGFIRSQCPRCGLDFKLKGAAESMHDPLAWWLQKSVRDAMGTAATDDSTAATEGRICCPYCGNLASRQDVVHPESVSYVRRIARREIVEPMISKMFSGFASGMRSSKYLKITVSGTNTRSARPISGPEPDDMVPVVCLCCGERFKVDQVWRGTVFCCKCHAELLPQ